MHDVVQPFGIHRDRIFWPVAHPNLPRDYYSKCDFRNGPDINSSEGPRTKDLFARFEPIQEVGIHGRRVDLAQRIIASGWKVVHRLAAVAKNVQDPHGVAFEISS